MTATTARRAGRRCAAGCGWALHPAAAAGHDGTPGVFDRHPGCEADRPQLRVVKGGKA
ncbi:hypothetical protein [Micromonospora rubida]|uniref:hypothetical protein n=1 Tax=Micromonospora rubida TaxID=2697657 RepID=UPI001376760F|nr:hypothetical protein [Micromonospora rubida]NBE80340.1 hypothetical protein [Micromonospora rubida]